ncbi:hypothetical protein BDN72DRAFT_899451 [Pluteus cervinus]|uniref:Uncharacterized protein n=1 Tax=Pluteus cervinus TaxID=181527 RepID=A0ACD3AMG4_9AGAR|nr:hypothetical protein BDN72DRAFT_899451 [Pluteus cervinus]
MSLSQTVIPDAWIQPLNDARLAKSIQLASMMLLAYDHLITLDVEIERVWSLPWRTPKILFFINRYLIPPTLWFVEIVSMTYNIDVKPASPFSRTSVDVYDFSCDFLIRWTTWPTMLTFGVTQLMLCIRVLALYNQSRRIAIFLGFLFVGNAMAFIAISLVIMRTTSALSGGAAFSGCLYSAPEVFYAAWIPPVVLESIIIFMTMYKVLQYQRGISALKVLARDSLLYFSIMSTTLLVSLLLARFTQGFIRAILVVPANVVACIAIARMTMNMRKFADQHSRRGTDSTFSEWTEDLDTLALPYLTRDIVTSGPVVVGYECDELPSPPPRSYGRPSTRG